MKTVNERTNMIEREDLLSLSFEGLGLDISKRIKEM